MRRSHRFPIAPPGDLIGVAKFADISAFAVPRHRGQNADRIVTLLSSTLPTLPSSCTMSQTLRSANLRSIAQTAPESPSRLEMLRLTHRISPGTEPWNLLPWDGLPCHQQITHRHTCKREIFWNLQKSSEIVRKHWLTWVNLVDFVPTCDQPF